MSAQPKITIKFPSYSPPIFLILLILKLTNTVDWSWWIITLPLTLPLGFIILILGVAFVGVLISVILDSKRRKF